MGAIICSFRTCSDDGIAGFRRGRLALALAMLATPVATMAQSADQRSGSDADQRAGSERGLEEIVVTAQRREENLQAIPVAVTAISSDDIDRYQVKSFNDITGIAPNVTSVPQVSGSGPAITIRGIIGGNAQPANDSGVALYLDGVILSRTTGAGFDVADLARVEVLRGPQGTLYGRNATGGAVNFITDTPKGDFYLKQTFSVGDLDLFRSKTRLDLPEFANISVSLNYLHDERDGSVRNTASGLTYDFSQALAPAAVHRGHATSVEHLGSRDSDSGLIAVRFAPSDSFVLDYKFDFTKASPTNRAQQVLVDQMGFETLRSQQLVLDHSDDVPMGFTTPEDLEVFGHNLTASYNITDAVQIKSITGYRGYETVYSNDVLGGGLEGNPFLAPDGTFELLGIVQTEKERTLSEEVQLTYQSDRVDAIGGLFYFEQHTEAYNALYFFQPIPTAGNGSVPTSVAPTDADLHNDSYAGFAQATLHVNDKLDLTGGIRQSHDKRKKESLSVDGPVYEASFDETTWTANVTYRPSEQILTYAKVGTGYISGGTNANSPKPFEPEHLTQYEVGVKSDLLDRRLRLNVAAFYSDYTDLQTSVNDPDTGLFITGNAGKAEIQGVEVELQAAPIDNLLLGLNYGYSHFKYKEYFLNGVDITDIANPDIYRPEHNLNLSLNYTFPEIGSEIKPSFNLNGRWHSDMSLYGLPSPFDWGRAHDAGSVPLYDPDALAAVDKFTNDNAVWDVNARLDFADIPVWKGKAKVSLWCTNLLDERTITNATSVSFFGTMTGQFHEPRMYGADLIIEF